MSDLDFPPLGSQWVHRRGGRVCKVVGHRTVQYPKELARLVEFRYRRTVGGMGRNRTTPTQTMPLAEWRSLFTQRYEEPRR